MMNKATVKFKHLTMLRSCFTAQERTLLPAMMMRPRPPTKASSLFRDKNQPTRNKLTQCCLPRD